MYLYKTDFKVALLYVYLSSLVCLMGDWFREAGALLLHGEEDFMKGIHSPEQTSIIQENSPCHLSPKVHNRIWIRLSQKYDFILLEEVPSTS